MFRLSIPVAAAIILGLAVGCESSSPKKAGDAAAASSSKAALSAHAAAASSSIPTSPADRRNDRVYAYVDAARADLSDGKASLINQVMRLSKEESAKFWPIYHDYEEELFALGDQRVELSRRYVKALSSAEIDDATATSLADDWYKIESQRLELMRKYHQQISTELSPIHAAQFTQIENRVSNITDLLIASELPILRTGPQHQHEPAGGAAAPTAAPKASAQ
jgi:Spy/CpxP family protein refolding chaperone